MAGHIELGFVRADGSFDQDGARWIAHAIQDAGYRDAVVCVCGSALRACQDCCELFHDDEVVFVAGDPYCKPCRPASARNCRPPIR